MIIEGDLPDAQNLLRSTFVTVQRAMTFTKEQVWKTIVHLQEPARERAFLDAFTGLRISELLALK
jgi:hypothetical protein